MRVHAVRLGPEYLVFLLIVLFAEPQDGPHTAMGWRIEPHTHIGDVDRILIDEQTREIEALVVRRGVVFSHDVILPIHYVVEVLDDIAHVNISDDDLERLAEFQAPPEPRSD